MSSFRCTPCLTLLCLALVGLTATPATAQGDLDAFMQQVMARRNDNWKKLQQYVLDERERVELRGPAHTALWGEQRDYTWYIRDGFFVRSPLKVNGATVGESDRLKYEADFLQRERRREARAQNGKDDPGPAEPPPASGDTPRDLDSLLRQTQQPQFISSGYFLRFKFDEGRYALVGREPLDGRQALRIEYYPTNLFSEQRRSGNRRRGREREEAAASTMRQLMNKTSKVTLWIEPESHQILKYVFDDLGWDFFPAPWMARVSKVTAEMTVGEAFPDVWLPKTLDMEVVMLMATGAFDLRYGLEYHDYRQPEVSTRIGVPGLR